MVVPPLLASIATLSRANLGILNQKLLLLDVMRRTFGALESRELFQQVCPIVKASIGQHIRHSMDHMELAAMHAADMDATDHVHEIHYDLRRRGGPDEYDIDQAQLRIERTAELFTKLTQSLGDSSQPVHACFMLSGDPQEFILPSTVARELGFAAHHGIHHMAMVKIIAVETLQIPPEALTPDFGKAPSTIVFDQSQRKRM